MPTGSGRRVPGLRREEVAALAGISPDYYVRLEQGRGHRPSPQVLDAIAAALQLDAPSRVHLHRLATISPQPPPRRRPEKVQSGISDLLANLDTTVSAFVQGRFMDVLASNRLARALSPSFSAGSAAGVGQALTYDIQGAPRMRPHRCQDVPQGMDCGDRMARSLRRGQVRRQHRMRIVTRSVTVRGSR